MEVAQPNPEFAETKGMPGWFNVEQMTDRQILTLNRALADAAEENHWLHEREADVVSDLCNGMLAGLSDDLKVLAQKDPARVRGIVAQCMESPHTGDGDLAVIVAPALASYDWEFTRDALIHPLHDKREDDSEVWELAIGVIYDFEKELQQREPERVADLRAHIARLEELRGY